MEEPERAVREHLDLELLGREKAIEPAQPLSGLCSPSDHSLLRSRSTPFLTYCLDGRSNGGNVLRLEGGVAHHPYSAGNSFECLACYFEDGRAEIAGNPVIAQGASESPK